MAKRIMLLSENNDYQRFDVLKRNRNKRHRYKEFIVEGVRNINQALAGGWDIKAFLYAAPIERPLSNWAGDILRSSPADYHYELTAGMMDKLSDKEDTSEIIAVVAMPEQDLSRIRVDDNFLMVVFDRPSNRGNLGTIIRSCDALNCRALIITGHSVDPFDPETIRSSMGSFFALPTFSLPSHQEVLDWVESERRNHPDIQIVGTSAAGAGHISQCDFTKPTVLLIGNETNGLTFKYKEMSDVLVKIPMNGSASSLNVACATSIVLYEIDRQRGFPSL